MKRLSAITLSLLLIWVQVIAMALPAQAAAPAKCRCCSCGTGKCCVGQSDSSEPSPQPATPVRSAPLNHQLFAFSASPAWLLPSGEAESLSAASASPLSAGCVPLFTRDCALLI